MLTRWSILILSGVLLSLLLVSTPSVAQDPSGRVAYLSASDGNLSYSPAGEDDWIAMQRNRPLIRGDRLWTDHDGRAELQVGSAAIRMGANTGLELLALDDRSVQLQLGQGSLGLTVRRLHRDQTFEIDTPTLALVIDHAGRYRIDVDERSGQTTVVVWEGSGDVFGDNSSFPLATGDAVSFYDSDLRDYELFALPPTDSFDRYCRSRDSQLARSDSLRYVDDDLIGYSQLDEYGRWSRVRDYGTVWFPNQLSSDWAPYRDGRWVWQEPWGWTWVDNAPWGFAPSHYGRWVSVSNRWGWVPGPREVRPVYAPALVAFVGGSNWSLSISAGSSSAPIGWFPLGPREVYMPSYAASRDYFTRVNVNNTVINNTVINNYYQSYTGSGYSSDRRSSGSYYNGDSRMAQTRYANRSVAGAITAVPQSVFVNSKPVRQELIRIDRNAMSSGDIGRRGAAAPTRRSVLGAAAAAPSAPPQGRFDRQVVARTAPPPAVRSFADRERQQQSKPGRTAAGERSNGNSEERSRTPQNVRLIQSPRDAVNARDARSTHGSSSRNRTAAPVGRAAEPAKGPDKPIENRGRGDTRQPSAAQGRDDSATKAPPENRGRSASTQQADLDRLRNAQRDYQTAQPPLGQMQERPSDTRDRAQEASRRQAERDQAAAQQARDALLQQHQREADAAKPARKPVKSPADRSNERPTERPTERPANTPSTPTAARPPAKPPSSGREANPRGRSASTPTESSRDADKAKTNGKDKDNEKDKGKGKGKSKDDDKGKKGDDGAATRTR